MADIKDVLERADRAFERAENSELPGCRQADALLGIGLSLLGIAMIIEDVELNDDNNA